MAVLGAAAAFCLGMSVAGTGTTYASLSDFGAVKASVQAGEWAPDPPDICDGVLHLTASSTAFGTLADDILGSGDAPGGNHPQVLMGYDGRDTLTGGNQKDCLVGGPGDDHLSGGNGKDVLDGGSGWDVCEGENGKDTFVGCEQIVGPKPSSRLAAPVSPAETPAETPAEAPAETPQAPPVAARGPAPETAPSLDTAPAPEATPSEPVVTAPAPATDPAAAPASPTP